MNLWQTLALVLSLSPLWSGCFETLDDPSPCYNLNETQVPNQLPIDLQQARVTLAEYKFMTLKDEALHCEAPLTANGQSVCQDFYLDKLSLSTYNAESLYFEFPSFDCLELMNIKGAAYGYCDLKRPSSTGCACLFHRDCEDDERCYAGRLYELNCEESEGNTCTRCLPFDEPPPLK